MNLRVRFFSDRMGSLFPGKTAMSKLSPPNMSGMETGNGEPSDKLLPWCMTSCGNWPRPNWPGSGLGIHCKPRRWFTKPTCGLLAHWKTRPNGRARHIFCCRRPGDAEDPGRESKKKKADQAWRGNEPRGSGGSIAGGGRTGPGSGSPG